MKIAEAEQLERIAGNIDDVLRAAFPCDVCNGRGGDNPATHAYTQPCRHCWGRGWDIPDEESGLYPDEENDE